MKSTPFGLTHFPDNFSVEGLLAAPLKVDPTNGNIDYIRANIYFNSFAFSRLGHTFLDFDFSTNNLSDTDKRQLAVEFCQHFPGRVSGYDQTKCKFVEIQNEKEPPICQAYRIKLR